MEALELHTGAPTVNLEDNTSCISVVVSKTVILELIFFSPVCFLQ